MSKEKAAKRQTGRAKEGESCELGRGLVRAEGVLEKGNHRERDATGSANARLTSETTFPPPDWGFFPADLMGLGVVGLTRHGSITCVNPVLASMLGVAPEVLTGTLFLKHIVPLEHDRFKAFLQDEVNPSRKERFILLDEEGRRRPAVFCPFPSSSDAVPSFLYLVLEIPGEGFSRQSIQPCPRMDVTRETVRRHVVICDESGCIIRTSGSLRQLCPTEPLHRHFDEVLRIEISGAGEAGAPVDEPFSISQVLAGKTFYGVPAILHKPDGGRLPCALEAGPLCNPEGTISGSAVTLSEAIPVHGVAGEDLPIGRNLHQVAREDKSSDLIESNLALQREILHRKQMENALIESEKRFRAIFEKAAIGMALVDLDGVPIAANPSLIELFGGSMDDLPSSLCSIPALEEASLWGSAHQERSDQEISKGDHFQMEKRYILKGGRLMWCHMTVSLIRDSFGDPNSAVVMLVDITERRQAERALRQSEARYRAIVEDQVELVSRIWADYTYSFVNEAYCHRFGKTREQLLGSSLWDHVPRKGRQRLKRHYLSLTKENPVAVIEHRVVMPNGEVVWQQWTDRAIFDDGGRLKEIQSVGRDITREKLAEKALQESERQLRYLSAQLLTVQERERKRIAHELHDSVGQYLSAIKYGMENLLQLAQLGDKEMVIRSLETLVPLTRNTIEEVRRIYMDLRPSLLDDLGIVPTVSWFCREFESIYTGIQVERSVQVSEDEVPEPLKIVLFRILQEALNNVARHSKAKKVSVKLGKYREGVEFVVQDDGVGFDACEAWNRTKGRGGLGLASMKERTELFGGEFRVESSQGKGALIRAAWPDLTHIKAKDQEENASGESGPPHPKAQ
ncbi:MAG: PAS domain S-box protein [Deltaproteobacteria bacterium]|nr:PAS domain S-box protein [Deltaproteobacteria bacterium]